STGKYVLLEVNTQNNIEKRQTHELFGGNLFLYIKIFDLNRGARGWTRRACLPALPALLRTRAGPWIPCFISLRLETKWLVVWQERAH
ncbi:hypothetical protein, partial [Achromobacter anxifer]|uniref:hypothetical protein n=1 Tax=Achromobacter anxifer TaxID=1287737 RepID=UPI0023F9F83B